ncbi:MAG: Lrp/AsnC ligand binding domain-containing protein [Thermoproteota archaeon]
MKAAVLVSTEPGKFNKVVRKIRKIAGVKKAFAVAGRVDIAVLAEAKDIKELSKIVLKIHNVPSVTASETLIEVQKG